MPFPLRFAAARRLTRTLAGAACATSALAFANSPPVPVSATAAPAPPVSVSATPAPPINAWRAPTLQVQGAEQPVRLASLQVDVEVSGGAAETRVQMVFFNPNSRVLEGKLQFPLAPGQVVSGFALDVDGRLRAAVPVEKARAQQVFEDIARRRVDPGLLQTTIGNNYELRVYPLLPGKTRTVELRIVEPAAGRLQVPLGYADRVDSLTLSLRVPGAATAPELIGAGALGLRFEPQGGGGFVARSTRHDVALPKEPLGLRLPASRGGRHRHRGARRPELLHARAAGAAAPRAAAAAAARPDRLGRLGLGGDSADRPRARAARRLLRSRARHQRQPGPRRRHRRGADPLRGARRRLDGAPARARVDRLRRREQPRRGAPRRRLGRGALVQRRPRQLRRAVAARLSGAGVRDHSAASSDPAALQALADASGGRSIDLATTTRRCAADALLRRGSEVASASALGARDLVVQSQSAAAGRLVVAGVLTAAEAEVTMRLRDSAGAVTTRVVPVRAGRNPSRLAALQWARLTLASLEGEARTNKVRIREIGKRFGLATRETSLIVLELLDDYVRHEIEPPAELRAAYDRAVAAAGKRRVESDAARLAQVVRRFEARVAWWNRDFPKGDRPAPLQIAIGKAAPTRSAR